MTEKQTMSDRILKNYIAGEWVESTGETIGVENPATGEIFAHVPMSTESENTAPAIPSIPPWVNQCYARAFPNTACF